MKNSSLLLLICISLAGAEEAPSLENYTMHQKISYEKISISDEEDMGLVGLGILFDLNEYWYGGVGLYGAVEGERGGFFTVGAESGLRYTPIKDFQLKSGLFLGAGGGGSAPQGGGLMLRPYIEGSYRSENFIFGLGVSHVNFPNGDIESTQLYVSAEVLTNGSYVKGHHFSNSALSALDNDLFGMREMEASFVVAHYVPSSDSLNVGGTTNTDPFTLAGIELDSFHSKSMYHFIQLSGAGGGQADGYMEVFGGLGYRYQLGALPLYFDAQGALGASGGGKVDTGGGLVYKVQAGLDARLTEHLTLGIKGGMVDAFNGTFKATAYSANIGYETAIMDHMPKSNDGYSVQPGAWIFRMIHKSHLNSDKLFKNAEKNGQVDLLGFAIDRYMNENCYLTGQTFWAYNGDAGGYAEGIMGVGYHSDPHGKFSLYAEALGGVGGGGGIDIGGGAFGSLGGGIVYHFDRAWEGQLGGSYVRSRNGTLSTYDIVFGVNYKFSLLEKK
ncbi:hypothetical protein YH65_00630 [Sulfurovum lithotrophicum]|uniref:Uncharacterized protein n=1 Tax=Sulfurovum lithotrophicum TaxID=206403 RepID=A0A7U4LZG3_9BACT|nr:hypothetical protein [Sulfurovum lithotrophicum]AKF24078.1 hypothetical protein YH65_00630 [Sulfurovum lithotrophicum]